MGVLQPLLERKYFLFWTVFPYSQMSQSSRHHLNTVVKINMAISNNIP